MVNCRATGINPEPLRETMPGNEISPDRWELAALVEKADFGT